MKTENRLQVNPDGRMAASRAACEGAGTCSSHSAVTQSHYLMARSPSAQLCFSITQSRAPHATHNLNSFAIPALPSNRKRCPELQGLARVWSCPTGFRSSADVGEVFQAGLLSEASALALEAPAKTTSSHVAMVKILLLAPGEQKG